ncbi:MAG: biopolymer transporter ExbD [Thiovulaceae bacterium]|nr:biopolymer transporter ExbD [Sulfurimonadaceae bacterium]
MMYDWDDKPELNITPLVDVMLVLLAILMVIAPNIVYEELINLPQGSSMKQISKLSPVHITIDKDKNVKVNNNNYELSSFADNFMQFAQTFGEKPTVTISADKTLDYGIVMSVIAAVKQAGFTEISLATNG